MKQGFLNGLLGARSRIEALRCLFSAAGELTGREIARRAGLTHPVMLKTLRELEAAGVVSRESAPPAYQYKLNRTHWVVSEMLDPLFRKERDWMDHLIRFLVKGVPGHVVSLALFGSVPQGRSGTRSDIDLLVIVDKKESIPEVREHFLEIGQKIYAAFRRPLAPIILAKDDLRAAHAEGREFAREVASTGRVIYGKLMTEVLFENGSKKNGQ